VDAPDLLAISLLLPLAGGLLLLGVGRWPNLREAVTLTTAATLFYLVTRLIAPVAGGAIPLRVLAEPVPGFQLALHAEPLGLLYAGLASFLWFVTSIYSIGYLRAHHEHHQTRFYFWFAIAISAVMGIAFAANLLTLFSFYELLTLATYPLVTHAQTPEARRAGRVYLGILVGTSMVFLLLAMALIWSLTGTLEFRRGGIFDPSVAPGLLALIYVLFVFGVGKAALMPFHRWLPAAMVAPTPVSALLHAVAVVKAGVFTILKGTVYLFGLDTLAATGANRWLLPFAALTILLASLTAMRRDNLKARLAYSTVSQLSYIVLGALLANVWGVLAGALHMVMHGFGKITLFFCAGAIQVTEHRTEISDMRGIGRRMPLTMAAFTIGALMIVGLPPLGPMWSKWYLLLGVFQDDDWLLVALLVLSTVLNAAYLLPIPARGFLDPAHSPVVRREAPAACLLALAITCVGCVALFFYAGPLLRFAALGVTP